MQEPIDNDMSEVLTDDELRDYYLEQYKKTDKFPDKCPKCQGTFRHKMSGRICLTSTCGWHIRL